MSVLKKQIFYILLFAGAFSYAQDAPVSISSSVDKSNITIGDLITYTVSVTHNKDVEVHMPGHGANLGGFEIRDYEVKDPEKVDGKIVKSVSYMISTFLTGEFDIPPLTIAYILPGDTIPQSLTTESIHIVVESMKASEAGDIRDVKPPLEIPKSWWTIGRWIILSVGILLIGILIYVLYRRKKAGKGLLPVRETPPRPPHEVALEGLEALRTSDLLENGEIKLYYIQISEIIRQYIGGRYFVVAMEMTTTEVLEGLRNEEIEDDIFLAFQTFLNRCDLVKFAKYQPSNIETEEIFDMATDLVQRTKLMYQAPEEVSSDVIEKDSTTDALKETEPVPEEKSEEEAVS